MSSNKDRISLWSATYGDVAVVNLSKGAKTRYERIEYSDRAGVLRKVEWLLYGRHHRRDGPAEIWYDHLSNPVYAGWCIKGRRFTSNKGYRKAARLTNEDMMAIVLKYGEITP